MDIHTYFTDDTPATRIAGSHDLLVEILSRVPARSLFRFKSVCRNWRWLISDDRVFALLHTTRNPKPSCTGLISFSSRASTSRVGKEKRFDFFWISDRRRFAPPPSAISYLESLSCSRILQSCNGLLLCSSSRSDCAYFVCNPSYGRFCKFDLPLEIENKGDWKILGLTLVFDVSRWSGFKVICSSTGAIDVYSSKEEEWKRLFEGPVKELNLAFDEGAYWDGKVIWLCKSSLNFLVDIDIDSRFSYCLVFDVDRETFDSYKLPCPYSKVCYFGESMGHLNLVSKDRETFDLYEMKKDMEWSLKYRVMEHVMRTYVTGDYLGVSSFVWDGSWVISVVWRQEQGEDDECLVMWYLPSGEGRVISYNCKTNLRSCLSASKTPGKTFQFIESLLWI